MSEKCEKRDLRHDVTFCGAMWIPSQETCKHYADGGDGYGCEHVAYDSSTDIPFINLQVCKYGEDKC